MKVRVYGGLVALALLCGSMAAANETLQEMTDKIDRAAEDMGEPHDAVSPALRDAFPGVDVSAHVHCVTQNASPDELSQMGGFVVGEGDTPSQIAASIAARTTTQDCFTDSDLPGLTD